jgi:hypothetical protein
VSPTTFWVSGSAHASSEHPDLARFFQAFPSTGSGKVRRREIARGVARDHTATPMMTT